MSLSTDQIHDSSDDHNSSTASLISGSETKHLDTDLSDVSSLDISPEELSSEIDGNDLGAVAVCGFSLKFPQDATSADSFWRMMCEKRCAMTDFPPNRLNLGGFYSGKNAQNTIPNRGAHFIKEDLGVFDAEFFGISPTEAAAMDPQQRWLLETAYRALENAGITMEQISGSATSVFTGSFSMDYMIQLCRDAEQPPTYAASGFGLSMLANRLSWFFNLHGPSIGVDSACSSSAMAIDIACQSLRSQECDASLVCGSNLTFSPEAYTWMSNINFLSPDSRCHSFDHRANGYARGEGIGVLVLKRLSDAVRDGNTIRAVIRATGSNEDGTTPGITQPSRTAQEQLIMDTYRKAGLSMAHTRYMEAHGTGTALGDPREAQAIGSAFQKARSVDDPMYIGAVKSNIGHLEGASGMAGVIKAILVLERAVIPPNTNFEKVNPKIDTKYLRIKFPQRCEPWPTQGLRRASVSSFGFGGSNSHVVLDDAYNYLRLRNLRAKHCTAHSPPTSERVLSLLSRNSNSGVFDRPSSTTPRLIVLSAADQQGMGRMGSMYKRHFESLPDRTLASKKYLDDLAFTLSEHRSRFPWRSFAVTNSLCKPFDFEHALSKPRRPNQTKPRTAFVFTGQGAQWSGMGKELMCYKTFRTSIEDADCYIRQIGCAWSPKDELLQPSEASRIDDPEYSQTLCTVLQVALVDLLEEVNIKPVAVVGHSSGEIAAAYCAGHISRESAWRLAYFRGVLSSQLAQSKSSSSRGAMMAVGLSQREVERFITSAGHDSESYGLTAACINSPNNVTLSGEERLIDKLKQQMDGMKIFARKLRVPLAYHSPQMRAISSRYVDQVASIQGRNPSDTAIPMISSVTGLQINGEELLNPEYWARNMVSSVQFVEAILSLCSTDETGLVKKIDRRHKSAIVVNNILEIGPHAALQGPLREIMQSSPRESTISYSSALQRNEPATHTFLRLMGELWSMGDDVKLSAANQTESGDLSRSLLVDLPEYPFDHSHQYWFESRLSKNYRLRQRAPHELLGARSNDWNPDVPCWRNILSLSSLHWLEQHQVNDTIIVPAAGMIAMVLEAALEISELGDKLRGFNLSDVVFENAMSFPSNAGSVETQVCLRRLNKNGSGSDVFDFTIYSGTSDDWHRNCYGKLEFDVDDVDDWIQLEKDAELSVVGRGLQASIARCTQPVSSDDMYTFLNQSGYRFGPLFQGARQPRISVQYDCAAEVFLIPDHEAEKPMTQINVVHPVALDAMLHSCLMALSEGGNTAIATSVPSRISSMWISKDGLNGHTADTSVTTITTVVSQSTRGFAASCGAISSKTQGVLLHLDHMELTNVTQKPAPSPVSEISQQRYSHLQTKVALQTLGNRQIQSILETESVVRNDSQSFLRELSMVQEICLESLLSSPDTARYQDPDSWQFSYLRWAEHHLQERHGLRLQEAHGLDLDKIQEFFDQTCERLSDFNYEGRLFIEVAKNLPAILSGQIDLTRILFQTELGKNFYEEITGAQQGLQISKYLDLLAHQTPGLRILEVGAGTGSGTRHFLDTLRMQPDDANSALRCKTYDFTDISPSFFEKARQEFGNNAAQMRFEVLDLERDYTDQGFQENAYDVIIAVSVMHVAADLAKALANARKVLKPGGKLILSESFSASSWRLGFVFGLLPGWWQGRKDGRTLSPNLSLEQWNDRLRQAGFSGHDIALHDSSDGGCDLGVIVSTAVDDRLPTLAQPRITPTIRAIVNHKRNSQSGVVDQLHSLVRHSFRGTLQVSTLDEVYGISSLSAEYVVFLADFDESFLGNLDPKSLRSFQALIEKVKHLLWVSRKPVDDTASPDYGLVDGLSRVLRSENNGLHLVNLLMDSPLADPSSAHHIGKILQEMVTTQNHDNYEQEYIEIDGVLHTQRLVETSSLKASIDGHLVPYQDTRSSTKDATPYGLVSLEPGRVAAMSYVQESRQRLSSDKLEISVKAVSIDAVDLAIASGEVSDRAIGRFCAGVVAGAGADTDFIPGDRVISLHDGSFRSHHQVVEDRVIRLPSSISFIYACAHGLVLAAAHYALVKIAKVSKLNTVLVHNGATPFGQAVIQICERFGIQGVFVTANSEKERDHILGKSALLQSAVLSHKSLGRRIRHAIDVEISDGVGSLGTKSADRFKPFARSVRVNLGLNSIASTDQVDSSSNVSTATVNIATIQRDHPQMLHDSLRYAIDHMRHAEKKTPGATASTFSASQVTEAFESLKLAPSGSNAVVDLEQDTEITIRTLPQQTSFLDGHATYIIVGGLGGIGREMARWLVQRGARYLVLMSRSGPQTTEAHAIVKELESQGVHVETPAADVANYELLRRVLDSCNQRMPPIKGCIHAGMVLRDSVFPSVQFDDWKQTIGVKAMGAWNLHNLLPSGLEFFIMISSMQGIVGRTSTGSYAAGNTYLDALARCRITQGERAASLCLGAVTDVGYLTEHTHLLDQLENLRAYVPMPFQEIGALLDVYCDPQSDLARSSIACQPIMGIKTPARAIAEGVELPFTMYQPMWRHLHHIPVHQSETGDGVNADNAAAAKWETALSTLATVETVPEAADIVAAAVGQRVASILGVPEDRLDDHKPMHSYGIDSLVATDLRNWMAKTFDVDVAVFDILGSATTASVAEKIARKIIGSRGK